MTLSRCLEKQEQLKTLFSSCSDQEEKYLKIIEMGRALPLLKEKTEKDRILECQSLLYLKTEQIEKNLFFKVYSNALISLGLAALLIEIYQGEPPEVILKCPPKVLKKIGIATSFSPGRINGLNSLYARMRRDACAYLEF
ncbi:MAG: SufE family protein [Chlamydiota bacterium]